MYFFYSLLLTLCLPLLLLSLWLKSWRVPAYRHRWQERLGWVKFPPLTQSIWIHAVSVGESVAAVPLILQLQDCYRDTPIVVTTTTPTGSARIQAAFKSQLGQQIFHCYLPYDYPWAIKRFIGHIQPKLLIVMETEIWPNLFRYCGAQNILLVIANARLSMRSLRGYLKLPQRWRAQILSNITCIAAQSALDAARYQTLGIPDSRVQNIGNIKFDLSLPSDVSSKGQQLRQQLGPNRPVWIAASTHSKEESQILQVFAQLKPQFPDLLLFLVPRHPQRFAEVAQLCQAQGWSIVKRSAQQNCQPSDDIFIGDSMGELLYFYAASDMAFVGGSLVPVGGHNMLEPAALKLPIVCGPHCFNFIRISELLLEAKGMRCIHHLEELTSVLTQWLSDPSLSKQLGAQAATVVEQNQGALKRLSHLIEHLLEATNKR